MENREATSTPSSVVGLYLILSSAILVLVVVDLLSPQIVLHQIALVRQQQMQ
jgi:hypothetical protein